MTRTPACDGQAAAAAVPEGALTGVGADSLCPLTLRAEDISSVESRARASFPLILIVRGQVRAFTCCIGAAEWSGITRSLRQLDTASL